MQQTQGVHSLDINYASKEEALFSTMTDLGDQCGEIATMPVTTKAELLDAKARLEQLISDMQALSNSLMEGTSSGINLGHVRTGIGFEESNGTSGSQGRERIQASIRPQSPLAEAGRTH